MANQLTEVTVVGLKEAMRGLSKAPDEMRREFRQRMRREVQPTVADIRGRFTALGRTGPATARTVRGSFMQNAIGLQMGGRGGPEWGFELATEFGAKGSKRHEYRLRTPAGPVYVTRTMPYSRIFGPWTGNQFTIEAGKVSGNAFYPGAAAHYRELTEALLRIVDNMFTDLTRAA